MLHGVFYFVLVLNKEKQGWHCLKLSSNEITKVTARSSNEITARLRKMLGPGRLEQGTWGEQLAPNGKKGQVVTKTDHRCRRLNGISAWLLEGVKPNAMVCYMHPSEGRHLSADKSTKSTSKGLTNFCDTSRLPDGPMKTASWLPH